MITSTTLNRLAAAQGIRSGLVDKARRRATPHGIDCSDLSLDQLSPDEFDDRLRKRREWCDEQCRGVYEIEPIRQNGSDRGRRFRFADPNDAVLFKIWFC
jgi:hypothetical protein